MGALLPLKKYVVPCTSLSGSISRGWLYDPNDFNWTQAAPIGGSTQPYTAVAVAAGAVANTAKFFGFSFESEEAEYTFKQSNPTGKSPKYEHQVEVKNAGIDQILLQWNELQMRAGCTNGIGMVMQLSNGKILVAGEQIVNAGPVDYILKFYQDGSSGTSGKKLDDLPSQTTVWKGNNKNNLIEFTGGLSAITALEEGAAVVIPTTFTAIVSYAGSPTPPAIAGVQTVAAAANATQLFEFNSIANPTGLPNNMKIRISATEVLSVDHPSDYAGQPFRYTHTNGIVYTGVFIDGNRDF